MCEINVFFSFSQEDVNAVLRLYRELARQAGAAPPLPRLGQRTLASDDDWTPIGDVVLRRKQRSAIDQEDQVDKKPAGNILRFF